MAGAPGSNPGQSIYFLSNSDEFALELYGLPGYGSTGLASWGSSKAQYFMEYAKRQNLYVVVISLMANTKKVKPLNEFRRFISLLESTLEKTFR